MSDCQARKVFTRLLYNGCLLVKVAGKPSPDKDKISKHLAGGSVFTLYPADHKVKT